MNEGDKPTRTRTRVVKTASNKSVVVKDGDDLHFSNKLTSKEVESRKIRKYATTTFGMRTAAASLPLENYRTASYHMAASAGGYNTGSSMDSQYGNFYSPQLSTDFLEKPQNLRERRAWYRHFYNSNEYVHQAIDLHTTLPLSKIRLEKPKGNNEDQVEYAYDFFVEMCNEMKLFKSLIEITHDLNLMGNVFPFCEDHEPYEEAENEEKVAELKEKGKIESARLFKEFKIIDKDPNYKGWRKIIVLPPDQIRIKKIPLSDESLIEFIPDPDTRKSILNSQDPSFYTDPTRGPEGKIPKIPSKLVEQLRENGSISLDTDPYSGSHVHHLASRKSQYETNGVSKLECCVNTLLYDDKLRQAQTSIASRHMTPMRVVWAEELSESDMENLREQIDQALVDPDYSVICNYQLNWQEMGSNGRILDLTSEHEWISNSLFAGLGVTRELLTGEGTYAGNHITLEILNTQYLLFRELLQEYVENNIFKPVAKKKGFIEKDKFGREKLIYPKLSFTRLAIKDNDAFFEQMMQLYNKGSISIDVILETLNIDPISTRKKIEADLFTVNDFAFNQLMTNLYVATATKLAEGYSAAEKVADYLKLDQLPAPPAGEEGAGGLPGGPPSPMGRFSSEGMNSKRQAAMVKLMSMAMANPQKMDKIAEFLAKK
jgi:hypothetical protein